MMFMPSMLLFIFVIIFSILLVVSAPSWLGAWVGLEVNLMSFVPMILTRGVITSVESSIKYFLVQAFSSLLMLLSILVMSFNFGLVWGGYGPSSLMLITALLIKLGAAPFHYWFPAVASGVGWLQNFVLMTWQKVGPLVLLSYVWGLTPLLTILVGSSVFVGSVGGLNQSSLRKLMAYSSINHLGWLLMAAHFGTKFMLIYFTIYMITNLGLVLMLYEVGHFYLSQVYYYSGLGFSSVILLMMWLSFGGLPPFVGFFGKWVVIGMMLDTNLVGVCLLMVGMSLVSLYYYTRVCYVVLNQSVGGNLMGVRLNSGDWLMFLGVMVTVSGLGVAPMFVLML